MRQGGGKRLGARLASSSDARGVRRLGHSDPGTMGLEARRRRLQGLHFRAADRPRCGSLIAQRHSNG